MDSDYYSKCYNMDKQGVRTGYLTVSLPSCNPVTVKYPRGHFETLPILQGSNAHVFIDCFPHSKPKQKGPLSLNPHHIYLLCLLGTSHILSWQNTVVLCVYCIYRFCEAYGQEGLDWVAHTFSYSMWHQKGNH